MRKWGKIEEEADIEREWAASSYKNDFLDVYGKQHKGVFDPRLRNVVAPDLSRNHRAGPIGQSG
jgi:hypothetical protein